MIAEQEARAATLKRIYDFDPPVVELLMDLGALGSMSQASFIVGDRQLDLWVVLDPWSLKDEERVYRLDLKYRKAKGRADLDIHVVSDEDAKRGVIPPADFVIGRRED